MGAVQKSQFTSQREAKRGEQGAPRLTDLHAARPGTGQADRLTLPLSGRQGAWGAEAESLRRPVRSRGLFEELHHHKHLYSDPAGFHSRLQRLSLKLNNYQAIPKHEKKCRLPIL